MPKRRMGLLQGGLEIEGRKRISFSQILLARIERRYFWAPSLVVRGASRMIGKIGTNGPFRHTVPERVIDSGTISDMPLRYVPNRLSKMYIPDVSFLGEGFCMLT